MLQPQGLGGVQRLDDGFPELSSVMGSGHEVDHNYHSNQPFIRVIRVIRGLKKEG